MTAPNKGRERLRRSMGAMFQRQTTQKEHDPFAITAPTERSRTEEEQARYFHRQRGRERREHRWES